MPQSATHLERHRYDGSAFHKDLPGGRASGVLVVGVGGLSFDAVVEGRDVRYEMPLSGLHAKLGGASNRIVFFSHAQNADCSLYTSDLSVLRDPVLLSDALVGPQLAGLRSQRRVGPMIVLAVFVLLAGMLVGLWAAKGAMVSFVANQVPTSAEVALGDAGFSQIQRQSGLIESPELTAQLTQMTRPLLDVIHDRYEFRLHIVDDASINAFALPGGNVVVTTGLIAAAKSADEVMGVLGHEVAHVTRRHSVRQLVSNVGLFVLVQALFGDVSGVAAVIANGGTFLLTQSYSRDFEREADDVGFDYLCDAKVDPHGLLSFFKTLEKHEQVAGDVQDAMSFLSSHPATPERIAHIESRIKAIGASGGIAFNPSAVDFAAFQRDVRAAAERRSATQPTRPTTQPAPGGPTP